MLASWANIWDWRLCVLCLKDGSRGYKVVRRPGRGLDRTLIASGSSISTSIDPGTCNRLHNIFLLFDFRFLLVAFVLNLYCLCFLLFWWSRVVSGSFY